MLYKKRGQGLPLNAVVIAILVVLVLVVLAAFFLFGSSKIGEKIRTSFFGPTSGTDRVFAIQSCENLCEQAQFLPESQQKDSGFCKQTWAIDTNNDGSADIGGTEGKVTKYYCNKNAGNVAEEYEGGEKKDLGVSCAVSCTAPSPGSARPLGS